MLPCWWGVALSQPIPLPTLLYWLILFALGALFMRSAGCIFNDWADQKLDQKVSRTQNRPLAAGVLTSRHAFCLFGIFCLLGGLIFLQLPLPAQGYSLIALLLLFCYPFMKRVTYFPQAVMGAAFGMGVPIAWAALNFEANIIPPLPVILLYLAALLWGAGYDTIYALQDAAEDQEAGIKSLTLRFPHQIRWVIGGIFGAFWLSLLGVGILAHLSLPFYLILILAGGWILTQQSLLDPTRPQRSLTLFLNNFWLGLLVFVGLLLGSA